MNLNSIRFNSDVTEVRSEVRDYESDDRFEGSGKIGAMTYYFYDLETTGFDARYGRIMQFAGQRTNDKFEPIGKPFEALIRISEEVLPSPEAVMVTGITPQMTLENGYAEAEFLSKFADEVLKPDTVVLGYNNVRFDDEFMRNLLYRNFYDPYEWQWKDGRNRWDLLDVGRMMRALRPEGINWPTDDKGNPTNRLEMITKLNDIEHSGAHDALADVRATIELAKLFKSKQPKLFDYLLSKRAKNDVAKLVDPDNPQPFVYSSGRYPSEDLKTTVVYPIAPHPHNSSSVLVYDLRHDPDDFADMSINDMIDNLKTKYKDRGEDYVRLPIKPLALNKCPAVAPVGVLDEDSWKRINLDLKTIQKNLAKLKKQDIIAKKAHEVWDAYGKPRKSDKDVEGQLYDGFMNDKDKTALAEVRSKSADELADYHPNFIDERLPELLLRYKARNYPRSLSKEEKDLWTKHVKSRLENGAGMSPSLKAYFDSIQKLVNIKQDEKSQFLLEELRLYGESLIDNSDTE